MCVSGCGEVYDVEVVGFGGMSFTWGSPESVTFNRLPPANADISDSDWDLVVWLTAENSWRHSLWIDAVAKRVRELDGCEETC